MVVTNIKKSMHKMNMLCVTLVCILGRVLTCFFTFLPENMSHSSVYSSFDLEKDFS